ncbi:MAG: hypothetical protein PWQ06_913, partial [Anaerophaga sp.]|nr:hypothetical protein [Anaerophaga sp.]
MTLILLFLILFFVDKTRLKSIVIRQK